MLSTQQIQYILSLHELKNFSRAAEECFVTQPTLSLQIKKAEEIVGFQIFDRNHSPITLTALGKELIPILQEIQTELSQITHLQDKAKGKFVEEIYVGIIPTISAYLLPQLYPALKAKLENVRLIIKELKTEELLEEIRSNKLDLAILAGPVQEEALKETRLFAEEILVYAPHLVGETLNTSDLDSLKPWLLTKGNCLRTQMVEFCNLNKDKNDHDWNFEGGNLEMLLRMVDINGGYTIVPANYVNILDKDLSAFKRLRQDQSDSSPVRSVVAVQKQRNSKQVSIQQIIAQIQFAFNTSSLENNIVLPWK
jgi:LysR family hydrogen peroxide-inducible transcriptional activator